MDMTASLDSLERIIRKGMRSLSTSDLIKLLQRYQTIRRLARGPLADIASDVLVLLDLVRDYANGDYDAVPRRTIFAAAFALFYVLDPVDLIPDFIPGIGYIDDAAVVLLVVRALRRDLDDYRTWSQKLARRLRHASLSIY